jgi:hypothetical protein
VEDHDTRECLRGIGSGCRESGLIDLAHDFRWIIANMLGVAEILIGSVLTGDCQLCASAILVQ